MESLPPFAPCASDQRMHCPPISAAVSAIMGTTEPRRDVVQESNRREGRKGIAPLNVEIGEAALPALSR
jgi:hypothetical protein